MVMARSGIFIAIVVKLTSGTADGGIKKNGMNIRGKGEKRDMADIEVGKDIRIIVNNNGVITFLSKEGKLCMVQVHPHDNVGLVRFLASNGYNFGR